MKKYFSFNLNAVDFLKVFLPYWVVFLGYEAVVLYLSPLLKKAEKEPSVLLPLLGIFFLAVFVFVLVAFAFSILMMRKYVSAVSLSGQSLSFKGSVPKFVFMNLGGILLSIITLGIYMPWYIVRVSRYLTGEMSYQNKKFEFTGKGGKLFLIMLLSFFVPLAAVIILYACLLTPAFLVSCTYTTATWAYTIPITLIFYIILIPFIYLIYKWYVSSIRLEAVHFQWNTQFFSSVFYILAQMLLLFVTLFICWPLACINIYRYFAGKTSALSNDKKIGKFGFEGKNGEGFLLFWGQALLSILTLGVYIPWAMKKMGNWMLKNTYYEAE
jgi:uncharacterized membrane protein YjgN (DUF898 family)